MDYFSFVNILLWEMGPFVRNMNLLVTAVAMAPLADNEISWENHIRESPRVSTTTLKCPWTQSIAFLIGEEQTTGELLFHTHTRTGMSIPWHGEP